jgi:uncharacterized membrane protein
MNYRAVSQNKTPQFQTFLLATVLLLGIFFRFANLDNQVYWVDEVATSLRISGYTKQEVIQSLSGRESLQVRDLQVYQQPNSTRKLSDSLSALTKSPEHAPLYFLLSRVWVQQLNGSPIALRGLSACFSLIAFPCLYWLCLSLFQSPQVGQVAVALFAVSPFYVAYAQEARPYSLWTVTILFSSAALVQAIRRHCIANWLLYALSLILGLYTSLLSIFVLLGQSIYVVSLENCFTKTLRAYILAAGIGIAAFMPWLVVLCQNWHQLQDNTNWMREPMPLLAILAVWLYSIVIIFVDFPVDFSLKPMIVVAVVVDLLLLVFVGWAIGSLLLKTAKRIWLLVLTLTLSTPLALALADLAVGGQASATPRYLIPAQLGIIVAVAHFLAIKFSANTVKVRRGWKFIFVMLLVLSTFFCIQGLAQPPVYQKNRNSHNLPIAALVNAATAPVLFTESQSIMDLLSLSHALESDVEIRPIANTNLKQFLDRCRTTFLFNPSDALLHQLNVQRLELKQVYQPELLTANDDHLSLWTIVPSCNKS